MPGLAEAIDPSTEETYRRGYRHGAKAILQAVEAYLSGERATVLRDFVERDLVAWSTGSAFQPPSVPANPDPHPLLKQVEA